MRGRRDLQARMLAHADLKERFPKDHPLRTIKAVGDDALKRAPAGLSTEPEPTLHGARIDRPLRAGPKVGQT